MRVAKGKMTTVKTLNEIAHLRDSRFGQPWPRHGLKLLYWMAKECISFDKNNKMDFECDPANGDFGFHHFENRYNEDSIKILPDVNIPYYVVGNLNSTGADELPSYVSEDYSPSDDESNTDRIIVSVDDDEYIERVYVTQHIDNSNYDPDATFRISKGLLMIIRRKTLEMFQRSVAAASPIRISHTPHFPCISTSCVAEDFSFSIFPEHPVNVLFQPLTTPSSHTPQTIPTSNVAVDLSANLSSELIENDDKEPPPIAESPDTIISMEEDLEDLPMPGKCWRNCAIL